MPHGTAGHCRGGTPRRLGAGLRAAAISGQDLSEIRVGLTFAFSGWFWVRAAVPELRMRSGLRLHHR